MNNQFATQFLLSEVDLAYNSLENVFRELGADEDLVKLLRQGVEKKLITIEKAKELIRKTTGISETSAVGGGVTGGPTAATFSPGAGEQVAGAKKAFKKKRYQEDAPRLAGSPEKTNKQGSKNLKAYSSVGFTKAPNAEEAGKKLKSIDVDMLWKEGEDKVDSIRDKEKEFLVVDKNGKKVSAIFKGIRKDGMYLFDPGAHIGGIIAVDQKDIDTNVTRLEESRTYSKFKKEAAIRNKPQQMHEAAKMINKKLEEVGKLLEFANQMRMELSEGEELLEYNHNTKKVFEKIHTRVVEVFSKVKKLK